MGEDAPIQPAEPPRPHPPRAPDEEQSDSTPNFEPLPTTTTIPAAITSPDDAAALLASWQLTPAERDRILHTEILPRELFPYLPSPGTITTVPTDRRRRRRPLAILVLGQTGAGKTRLAPLILDALYHQRQKEREQQQSLTTTNNENNSNKQEGGGRGGVLHLIADTFKTYHPSYAACSARLSPAHASRLASADAAAWLLAVCAHAAHSMRGSGSAVLDVVVETACRRPGDLRRLVDIFSSSPSPSEGWWCSACASGDTTANANTDDAPPPPLTTPSSHGGSNGGSNSNSGSAGDGDDEEEDEEEEVEGYEVRAAVLAVPAGLSRLGIAARYHGRRPEAGSRGLPARLTPRAVHDDSYAGLADAVAWLDGAEGRARVGRVVVVRRSGAVVYDDNRGHRHRHRGRGRGRGDEEGGRIEVEVEEGEEGRGQRGGALLAALEAERRRGLSAEERRMAEEDLELLREIGDPGVDREIEEVERLLAGLGGGGLEGALSDVKLLDATEFVS